jgi:beta-galactosidase
LEDHPSARLRLRDLVASWYAALAGRNVGVDFVPPDGDLAGYRLVLVPNLYLMSDATAARFTSYVDGGGRLVCGFFSGIVDEHDHIHLGGYPAPLRDVLGVVVDEFWPVPDGASVPVSLGGRPVTATMWSEWLEALTAEVVGSYTSGELDGRPAVTRNAYGEGRAWYVGCHLGGEIGLVLDEALADAGVRPVLDAAPGVGVTRRDGPENSYYFLLNQAARECETPAPDGVDLLTGAAVRRTLHLPPYGAAVVKTARP